VCPGVKKNQTLVTVNDDDDYDDDGVNVAAAAVCPASAGDVHASQVPARLHVST